MFGKPRSDTNSESSSVSTRKDKGLLAHSKLEETECEVLSNSKVIRWFKVIIDDLLTEGNNRFQQCKSSDHAGPQTLNGIVDLHSLSETLRQLWGISTCGQFLSSRFEIKWYLCNARYNYQFYLLYNF